MQCTGVAELVMPSAGDSAGKRAPLVASWRKVAGENVMAFTENMNSAP